MFVNNIEDKDSLLTVVQKELRDHGIKYQKSKKRQLGQDKSGIRKIFHTPLHQLELTDGVLVNGSIVQVPKFVSDACQRILDQVTTEGLFRKAGSAARQKAIRRLLESGENLEKSYPVVDVANLLKSFFRELPEALLPSGNVQDSMLRCLFTGEQKLNTLLLTCLLLPPLTLNVLAFFMQFLHTVSLHSDQNRMTIENLAIIFTPSLMPLPEMYPTRLNNYVKIIEMLIFNSDRIGMVPEKFLNGSIKSEMTEKEEKKKKKRRSGSLTRVFNGLKRIVGVRGSSDDLDKSVENLGATPCLTKSTKKRKAGDQSGLSAKKKKQIMALLPNGSLLPNTPMLVRENKKIRLSFGSSRRITKFPGVEPPETITEAHLELPQMERRWSVVGTPIKKETSGEFDADATNYFSPVVSLPCLNFSSDPGHQDMATSTDFVDISAQPVIEDEEDKDYVRIPKSEYRGYQALNKRLSAIEARISQEFAVEKLPADPELVQDIYEQTLEEAESINHPATDELARRLSRDLKIRRSDERRIFRSPSARKIGTIRRRSRESSAKVTRAMSWHLGTKTLPEQKIVDLSFYPKTSLKRGRPNTVQSGLRHPSPAPKTTAIPNTSLANDSDQELWTSAEEFFLMQPQATDEEKIVFITEKCKEISPYRTPQAEERRQSLRSAKKPDDSPRFKTQISVNDTPMLPPTILPKKTPGQRQKMSRMIFPKTPFEDQHELPPTGRASIARLRSQNAGMVAAKAKLFDGLSDESRPEKLLRGQDTENATPKRGRNPKSQRLRMRDGGESSRVLKQVNEAGGGQEMATEMFLKPPAIRSALMENTPKRLVKVSQRLHSPNTPMKAFRAASRSPRVPRNYRSPRH